MSNENKIAGGSSSTAFTKGPAASAAHEKGRLPLQLTGGKAQNTKIHPMGRHFW